MFSICLGYFAIPLQTNLVWKTRELGGYMVFLVEVNNK